MVSGLAPRVAPRNDERIDNGMPVNLQTAAKKNWLDHLAGIS
jgi:hypothetical protein